jgi:RHS repeat-associated protein
VDTFTFDTADRLTQISDANGSASLFAAVYSRDANGQVTADTSATATQTSYRYTALNQVCYAGLHNATACSSAPPRSQPFTYDTADNLTQMGATQQAFNAAGQLCWTGATAGACASPPAGATRYTYDARGNRTQVAPSGTSTTTLTYDQANRLTGYGSAATYAYNGDGLRMSKTPAGAATTRYVWNVSASLPLLLQDGTASYVYGPGGLPLEQITGSAALFYHHDGLGSTRLLTTAAGASSATYTYDPYGNLTASTGTASNPFLYAGQYRDAESGFYFLRARFYDPSTGQFLSRDPLVATTRSPYGYVNDNPLNGKDPSGLAGTSMSPDAQHCDRGGNWGGVDPQDFEIFCGNGTRYWTHHDLTPQGVYVQACFSVGIGEGCLTLTDSHCYLSGGPGLGTPGPSGAIGFTPNQSPDQLIEGWSGHVGGQYGVGGGYAQSPNGVGGPYVSFGLPGAGGFWTFGHRLW